MIGQMHALLDKGKSCTQQSTKTESTGTLSAPKCSITLACSLEQNCCSADMVKTQKYLQVKVQTSFLVFGL